MHLHTFLTLLLVIFLITGNTASVLQEIPQSGALQQPKRELLAETDVIETDVSSSDIKSEDTSTTFEMFPHRTPKAGRGRKGSPRNRRPKPTRIGESDGDFGPIRRQENTQSGPGLNITSVSPIELSLGGLTGLQGLPPLSLIQFVKLLVAVTPFIIPIIFVPLLIFTVGMFMIPVQKPTLFLGAGGNGPVRRSWTSFSVIPTLTNVARNLMNHEECFEKLVCEISGRYLEKDSPREGSPLSSSNNSIDYRSVIGRVTNQFKHPVMRRLSTNIRIPKDICKQRQCSFISFIEKSFNQ